MEHWNEELQTAVPVSNQQHHTDEVEYPHKHAGDTEKLTQNMQQYTRVTCLVTYKIVNNFVHHVRLRKAAQKQITYKHTTAVRT